MLKLENVTKEYKVGAFGSKRIVALTDFSLEIKPGEVVSLIGESGSGKTTVGRMILGLLPITEGSITYDGVDISDLKGSKRRHYYKHVQGVFQDPFSSYNPVFKVDRIFSMIRRAFVSDVSDADWRVRLNESLEAVGLDPRDVLGKYPHQLSGGQLQRLLIARALMLDLKILVADEVISMLDASTRIDVLNLLGDLKQRGLGVLFVTHDLSLGNYISDRAVILRHGRIVELGPTELVFGNPLHPYTKMLLASVPQVHTRWTYGGNEMEIANKESAALGHELFEAEPGHFVAGASGGT